MEIKDWNTSLTDFNQKAGSNLKKKLTIIMDIEKELQNVLKLSPFRNHYKNDDNFLKLLSKITTKVTTKYNLKVENLKSVIHEFENHYHKSCLNFERKNDVNYAIIQPRLYARIVIILYVIILYLIRGDNTRHKSSRSCVQLY